MASIETVSLDIAVVLGSTDMPVHQVLRLGRGAIIELDATEDDEVQDFGQQLSGRQRHRGDPGQPHRGRGQVAAAALAGNTRIAPRKGGKPRPCMGWLDLLHRRRLDAGFPASSLCGHGGIGRRTSLRC